MAADKDVLEEAKERFENALDAWSEVRAAALDDLRFARLGDQWPPEIAKQRQLEGRPCLTLNRLPAYIRQVVNDARQNKPTIRVRPVDDTADVNTAEIFNGIIRHIEMISDADVSYDTAIDCSVTQGMGFFYIDIDYAYDNSFDLDIFIRRVSNPQSVLFDPNSEAADSSDWDFAFITEDVDRETFKKEYPDAELTDWDRKDAPGWFTQDTIRRTAYWSRDKVKKKILQLSNGEIADAATFEKPDIKAVFDAGGITVVNERAVNGYKVTRRLMTGTEILETTEWAGKYIPVVPVFGEEINDNGRRVFQSLVRHAKDSQRNFNYWRTTATELVALAPKAPWVGPEAAFEVEGEAEKWATANTQSHAFLRYKGSIPPERQPFAGVPAGAVNEAVSSADDMKAIIGMFDASMGAPSNEKSGVAIMKRQRESDTGSYHYIDNLTRAIRCAGKILVDLIPQVYTPGRIVRVIGEDGMARMVKTGQPPQVPPAPQLPPNTPPEIAAQVNQQYQAEVEKQQQALALMPVYDLSVGNYDVESKAGPSFTSRREEAADAMIRITQANPAAAGVLGSEIVRSLDLPKGEEIAAKLDAAVAAQAGQGQQGAPDVVGAAKVQADAKLQTNRESLQADVMMNREKLQAQVMMNHDKIMAEAAMKKQQQDADAAESTGKNLTQLATTALKTGHVPGGHADTPEFLKPMPPFNPNAGIPAP